MDQPGSQPAKPASKPHNNGCADVKPRLTKEQQDILEREFFNHHKPTTLAKRGFAETLNVPVDKINNWFQNRRAKVKQDHKKRLNAQNMNIAYNHAHIPMMAQQYPSHIEHPQPQPLMVPGLTYHHSPIIDPANPVQSVEGSSAMELASAYPMIPYGLGPIPEVHPSTMYGPNAVMQHFSAAAAGLPYTQTAVAVQFTPQDLDYPYEANGLPEPNYLGISMPTNTVPNEPAPDDATFQNFTEFTDQDLSAPEAGNISNSANLQFDAGSLSPDRSPASGAGSQSSGGHNVTEVQSITSKFSGYTDDQIDWMANGHGPTVHTDMYQHPNASAQNLMPSPQYSAQRKLSTGPGESESFSLYPHDAFSRRNSSTTNLANNIGAIDIHNRQSPDASKQRVQPSSIAARRQKAPTALNSTAMRSASFTTGMPSPGSNDHTLRRIRSSGIPNAGGRVQKSNPGSAPRSPLMPSVPRSSLKASLKELDHIPKFFGGISNSQGYTVGKGGSRGPPTPSTPGDTSFPSWQSNTTMNHHAAMPQHSSPESLNAWPVEPQSAGLYSSTESPSSMVFQPAQLHPGPYMNDNLYHDTPPQSAPATQQHFSSMGYTQSSLTLGGYHSTSDLVPSRSSHIRRPSLPDSTIAELNQNQTQYPVHFNPIDYDNGVGAIDMHGIPRHGVPFAPQVHDYPGNMPGYYPQAEMTPSAINRRSTEPQAKNYTFANTSPENFRQSE